MNTGQQLLTVAALVLLTTLLLNVYRSSGYHSDSNYQNEAILTGTAIGQSMLEEILNKSFDEKTISTEAKTASDLSAVLGPDTGENNVSLFDDIDDYLNYTRSDSLERMGKFNIKVEIYYVQKMNPETKSYVRTFSKRIDVKVTNITLPDTLKLNYIEAY